MRAVGNGVAARAFGAEAAEAKPSCDAAPEAKHAYARRKYEDCMYGVPTYHEAVSAAAPIAAVPARAPAAARAPAVTAAAPITAPVAALAPRPQPSAANADGWALIHPFDAPPAPPGAPGAPATPAAPAAAAAAAAAASTAAVTAAATAPAFAAHAHAHAFAAPARAVGHKHNTAELLRLFDPLPQLTQPPSKPTTSRDGDAFFATFGL